ncbi:unnamed protein product [Schistosoma curassoni]|uniref:KH_dom_type_1 domain-containing protein n=1 Tax=Schistosoma curassoni TaxID=6186 RepID=A0A183JK85_9TREM|nr:unnamed protein product [Schistosoma curassoni]
MCSMSICTIFVLRKNCRLHLFQVNNMEKMTINSPFFLGRFCLNNQQLDCMFESRFISIGIVFINLHYLYLCLFFISKRYFPVFINYNFVGRILGPHGSTAKCLQQFLGVRIMIRGRGSMRDQTKIYKEDSKIFLCINYKFTNSSPYDYYSHSTWFI